MEQNKNLISIIIVLIVALIVILALFFMGRVKPDIRSTGEQLNLNGNAINGEIIENDREEPILE